MIDRKEFMQEMQLRKHIRKAIKAVQHQRGNKEKQQLQEERHLRTVIQQLIKESGPGTSTKTIMGTLLNEADPAVAADAVHSNTGINALEDLFKNTNLLSILRKGYKSLTTRKKTDPRKGPTKQRTSYMNHILSAVGLSMEVEASRHDAPSEEEALQEDINIDIGRPEDNPAFIDVEKREPTEDEEVEEFSLAGHDKTGRNKAYTDYKNVEKNIITAFDDLDDPQDRSMFKDYLLTNLKLYFERFEEELIPDPPAPEIETPEGAVAAHGDVGEELGLQEEINADMDEIVEWLLLDATK